MLPKNEPFISTDTFRVSLTTFGSEAIVLVHPGDGSEVGWRTPVVRWQVENGDGVVGQDNRLRCGNVNALQPDEVFELEPGGTQQLASWIPPIQVNGRGRYRITLIDENDPTLPWKGVLLDKHDEAAMKSRRASTACNVISNTVELTVTVK